MSVRPAVPATGEYLTCGVASGESGLDMTSVSSAVEEAETATVGLDAPSLSDAGGVPPTAHSPAAVGPETASLNVTVTDVADAVVAENDGANPSAAVTVAAATALPAESSRVGVAGGVNATVGRESAASGPATR